MELAKWRAQVNVKDDDLSLINICLHCHFYLLKRYSRTSGQNCSNDFGINYSVEEGKDQGK